MLIIVTNPCGCGPYDKDHSGKRCVVKRKKDAFTKSIQSLIENFRRSVEAE